MSGGVRAEVVSTMPSLESVPYVTAVLRFRNAGSTPVRVQRYRIVWDGGSVTASPTGLVVPPGGDREWRIRIDRSHGALDALARGAPAARVDVLEVAPVK